MFGDETDCGNKNGGMGITTTSRASRCVQIDTTAQASGGGSYDDEIVGATVIYSTSRNNKPVNTGGSRRVQLQDNFMGDSFAQQKRGGSCDDDLGVTTAFYATSCNLVNLGTSRNATRSVQLQEDFMGSSTGRTITCTFPLRNSPGKANQSNGALSSTSITKKAPKVASVASRAVSRSRHVTHAP